jgi:putative ATP-binding cassette transporter
MVAQSGQEPDQKSGKEPDKDQERPGQSEESMGGLIVQLSMMMRAFNTSPHRNRLLLLLLGVFLVIVGTAYLQILLNAWNQPFYDSLARKDLPEFLQQLLVFIAIAGGLLILNVTQTWLNLMVKLKLRQGLVEDLISQWMKPRRAFRLANSSKIGVNPDQRLHEDARHLTELSTDLGIGLLQASILLVSFVAVLWNISSGFAFDIGGYSIVIPGYMVWAAIFYATTASLISWHVGGPLIGLNADRYAREAEFRFSLVRVSEHVDAIALNSGEKDEERQLNLDLAAVLRAMRRLVTATTKLAWVTSGYGWFTILAPILVAAPIYFAGSLTFGGLMVAVGAFNQVQQALRWFVDNFNLIADWRATLLRVANFRHAVTEVDTLEPGASRIQFQFSEPGQMTFEGLVIEAPSGRTRLREEHVTIKAGERFLITSDPGASKTLLFRAIAGLWPFGEGQVGMPKDESVTFMPRRPYLPQGTLRQVLSYPHPVANFEQEQFQAALSAMGLAHLFPELDRNVRWDKDLGDEEQQGLAFARLALQKPAWVVIDEALEALDDEGRLKAAEVFAKDLTGSAIILIGKTVLQTDSFQRSLHLISERDGQDDVTDEQRDNTQKAFWAFGKDI